MSKRMFILVLAFSLAFNVAFAGAWLYNVAAAQSARPRPPAGHGPPPWARIGLRPEVERKLHEEWGRLGSRMEALQAEAAASRGRFLELMAAEEPDEEALLAEHERLEAVQGQVRQLVVREMIQTRRVLTPEERQKWLHMMRARGRSRGWRPAGSGGPMAPPPARPARMHEPPGQLSSDAREKQNPNGRR